jgi:nicotinamidase/pyrazinamidase
MLAARLVFVDIDTQRDFLEPTGALYVPGSTEILPKLQRLTQFARSWGIAVLATSCAHHPDDAELRFFPAHCMAETAGQERVSETAWPDSLVLDVDDRLDGIIPPHLTLLKRDLDVFSRQDADELIARYDQDKPTFVVYGVATDYCVSKAVHGLMQRRCHVIIVADAVRAIDASSETTILTDFARSGVTLTLTEVVCRHE